MGTPNTDPAPVDDDDDDDEMGITAFAYTPDDRMDGPIMLDEESWARFYAAAGLNLDGSPATKDPPTD